MKCPFRTIILYTRNKSGYTGNPYATNCEKERAQAEKTEYTECLKQECPFYFDEKCKRVDA